MFLDKNSVDAQICGANSFVEQKNQKMHSKGIC